MEDIQLTLPHYSVTDLLDDTEHVISDCFLIISIASAITTSFFAEAS